MVTNFSNFVYKITLYPFNNIIDSFKSNVITTKFSTIFLQTV